MDEYPKFEFTAQPVSERDIAPEGKQHKLSFSTHVGPKYVTSDVRYLDDAELDQVWATLGAYVQVREVGD